MTIRIARAAIVRHFEGGLSLTGTAIQFGLEPNRLQALCSSLGIEPPAHAYKATRCPPGRAVGMITHPIERAA